MPIYEYQCRSCGYRLEAIQAVSDEPLIECPACQEGELKRLVSAVAFQLKGTGWYETDFKNKGRNTANQGGADGSSEQSGSTSEAASSGTTGSGDGSGDGGSAAGQKSAAQQDGKQGGSPQESSTGASKAASEGG